MVFNATANNTETLQHTHKTPKNKTEQNDIEEANRFPVRLKDPAAPAGDVQPVWPTVIVFNKQPPR